MGRTVAVRRASALAEWTPRRDDRPTHDRNRRRTEPLVLNLVLNLVQHPRLWPQAASVSGARTGRFARRLAVCRCAACCMDWRGVRRVGPRDHASVRRTGPAGPAAQVLPRVAQVLSRVAQVLSRVAQVVSRGAQVLSRVAQVVSRGAQVLARAAQVLARVAQVLSRVAPLVSRGSSGRLARRPGGLARQLGGLAPQLRCPRRQFRASRGQFTAARGQFTTARGQFRAARVPFRAARGQFTCSSRAIHVLVAAPARPMRNQGSEITPVLDQTSRTRPPRAACAVGPASMPVDERAAAEGRASMMVAPRSRLPGDAGEVGGIVRVRGNVGRMRKIYRSIGLTNPGGPRLTMCVELIVVRTS